MPGVSPAAKQMGRAAAANIVRRLRGEPTPPFRYRDYGNLATVGRKAAIVELAVPGLGALRFGGLAAWLFWLFAHIYFLIGFRNRLMVMVDWAWAYFTYERSARVVAEPAAACAGTAAAAPKLRGRTHERAIAWTRAPRRPAFASNDPGRAARRRLRRRARAVERPAPLGVPARALAGAAVGCRASPARWATLVVTHRARRAVRRQPLLGPGRAPSSPAAASSSSGSRRRPRAQHIDWLCANVARGATVAVDGNVLGLAAARQLRARARRARHRRCAATSTCVAAAWPERPALPAAPVYEHRGAARRRIARAAKLAQVRAAMARRTARRTTSISTVDDIAWLLNLRGADVGYNPVFLAHLLLDATAATLFVGAGKVDAALARALAADGVAVAPYADVAARARGAAGRRARCSSIRAATTLGLVERGRRDAHRGDQPEHARQEPQERRRGGQRARAR